MSIGPETDLADRPKQLLKTIRAIDPHSHNQLIDEEAYQVLDLGPVAVGDIGPDCDIGLSGVAADQDREAAQQGHKESGAGLGAQGPELRRQLPVYDELPPGASIAGGGGPWMIGRERGG